ncbi:Activator of stress 1 [Teratosphaeria destructans]|uniref:Activator of stress 1 n=1 Tax=Teratosphaeria destructans TaxID=418781 RepID=A0A9W7STG4_9PEZI|nr:Activator of stress 1 [Teratosphaeria destructans]
MADRSDSNNNNNNNTTLKRLADSLEPAPNKRSRTGNTTRTGQACDRCKIRKIRCDARPGGCSPCLQNNSECKTTDRITGRAIQRGHTENLENENTQLKMYIIELQAQLKQHGVEPGAPPAPQPGYAPIQLPFGASWDSPQSNGGYQSTGNTERHGIPVGCIGDNYLGVASENNWLSAIEGTSLALFGTKIDLAEFMPPEPNPDASAMSYQTFLGHAFGSSPTKQPELPDYQQCKVYAEWYFRSIQNFTPILHKPDFMNLIYRMYHDAYQPSPAETVMVHMMLAVMNFQWSSRNGSEQARSSSFEHYHFALTFIPQLITGHKLEDIQALTLICSQLRNQPRPGAAWMFTNMVIGLAIESGLHRSVKSWSTTATQLSAHTIEMRKRIFWSLLLFHVAISSKLGRPMPLRFEDFDIEIPDAVDDNLPGEQDMTKWKRCSWRAAIQGFKLLKILMQVCSTIYTVRSSSVPYEVNVRQLEKDLQAFQAQVPPELAGGPQTREEDRVSALYLQVSAAECELLLHHPALCRATSTQVVGANLDLCLAASNKMLHAAAQLKQLKSLDTTWYYGTDFLAAIFTTLFALTEKRDQMTSANLQQLRQDMDSWLEIMGEVGKLLGTGPKLQEAVRNIIEYSIGNINRHLTAKTASAAIATATAAAVPPDATNGQEQQDPQQTYEHNNDYYSGGSASATNTDRQRQYSVDGQTHAGQAQAAPFTDAVPQYYQQHQYAAQAMAAYNNATYDPDAMKSNIEAQLNTELGAGADGSSSQHTSPQHAQATTQYMAAFQSPAQQSAFQAPSTPAAMQPGAFQNSGHAAWRHFADNMLGSMGVNVTATTDYGMSPAGGMILKTDGSGLGTPPVGSFGGMQMPADGNQSWPLIHYQNSDGTQG